MRYFDQCCFFYNLVIFFTNAKDLLTKLMKTIGKEKTGLKVLETVVTDIPGFGTDLAEVSVTPVACAVVGYTEGCDVM